MVGSLIQVGSVRGVVVDAALSPNGSDLVHKIKWLPRKGQASQNTSWVNLRLFKKPNEFKVLVKCDLYGEEQAGL